jgi:hypothetical protein
MRTSGVNPQDHEPSKIAREFALAQASMQQAIYFVGLGANDKAAAYFQFAAQRLQGLVEQLTVQGE